MGLKCCAIEMGVRFVVVEIFVGLDLSPRIVEGGFSGCVRVEGSELGKFCHLRVLGRVG